MDSTTEADFWEKLGNLRHRLHEEEEQLRVQKEAIRAQRTPQHWTTSRNQPHVGAGNSDVTRGAVTRYRHSDTRVHDSSNADFVIKSLTDQLGVLEAQQQELARNLEIWQHRQPYPQSKQITPRASEDALPASHFLVTSMQQQHTMMMELLRDRKEEARHAPAIRQERYDVPAPVYPMFYQGGLPSGPLCQQCQHPTGPAPQQYPNHAQPVPSLGTHPLQPAAKPNHTRRRGPTTIPTWQQPTRGMGSEDYDVDPMSEPHMMPPEQDRERAPNAAAAARFRKAILAICILLYWKTYPEKIRAWCNERKGVLQQKIKRSLPSALHHLFRKESGARQVLKTVVHRDAIELKIPYRKNAFQLSFPKPETKMAYSTLANALEAIVKDVCELKPESPGLSQRVPMCMSLLLEPNTTVYPDDYLWPAEQVKLQVSKHGMLKELHPGGAEALIIGFVFGRALLTEGLLSPAQCGLVDTDLDGKLQENLQVLVTVLYHVLRLTLAALTQPQQGSARSASVDPLPADPSMMERFPLLLPDEDVKIYLKKHDRLLHTLQQQLVIWTTTFASQLQSLRDSKL
ncbi:uncharacterized protein LOC135808582 isoform X1 [Sycon ciliatum]|uniref:uncharacterized protein LOC135808582 isoform X1 n=1 Tax=Sycon ciliatum TaxID=27933 RepID=UPI0031F702E9